jgi:major intracellular serine protease
MKRDTNRYRLPPLVVEHVATTLSETIDWGLAAYNIPQQWKATRGENVTVAVLDTGIDANHPDLAEALVDARDFTRSKHGAADRHGHGTHVAGIVAARHNATGVVGVAHACRLLAVKVLDDDGSGASEAIAAGIVWACRQGADILSLSFGSREPDALIEAALAQAVQQGKFVLCAAGNDGRDNSIHYPARLATSVAVGAVDRAGKLAPFSSRGAELDICAPGEHILSTWKEGGYARLSGTSMATPFVTGVVALMLAAQRKHSPSQPLDQRALLERLQHTATDAGAPGHDPHYGYGLIDPARLIASSDTEPIESITIEPVRINGIAGKLVFVPS